MRIAVLKEVEIISDVHTIGKLIPSSHATHHYNI